MKWIVTQLGAREHYAVPRALHEAGGLISLLTDFWIPPGHPFGRLPHARRLRDRYHPDLKAATVHASNSRMLAFEVFSRISKRTGWREIQSRNRLFQARVLAELEKLSVAYAGEPVTLFSYSYAALELFRFAKSRGWKTVLGQIDPGPEEERIVEAEHQRFPQAGSATFSKAPDGYWHGWREELALADAVVINSRWSADCLAREGVDSSQLHVVPLVYSGSPSPPKSGNCLAEFTAARPLEVLFLGQILARKGVFRLVEAMKLLRQHPVRLTLVGPLGDITQEVWSGCGNVRWLGPAARSAVPSYYEASDLFILPTLSDGYAITQLEALAHGLPVMASRFCGEAVDHGQNGWLLESLEPSAIADAILRFMEKPMPRPVGYAPTFTQSNLAASLHRMVQSGTV